MMPSKRMVGGAVLFVAVCSLAGPDAWAFRAPERAEEAAAGPVIRAEELPAPPGSLARREAPMEELAGAPRQEGAIVSALRRYVAGRPEWLGAVPPGQLRATHVATVPGQGGLPTMVYVQFVQQQEGLDVDGSYVNLAVKLLPGRSVLVSARARVYPQVSLLPATIKPAGAMRARAAQALGLSVARATAKHERVRLRYLNGRWRRTYEARFAEHGLKAVVDQDTAEAWSEDDRLYAIDGQVKGRGIRFNPQTTGTNLETLDLPDLKVSASSGSFAYTSSTGQFSLPISGSTTLTALLQGRWANVTSLSSSNLSLSATATSGVPLTLLFNPTGAEELATAQVNGYYHTSLMRNWVQTRLAPAGSLAGLDIMLPVRVNIPANCNAYYTPGTPTMNFYRAGGGCYNTAYDTIIYHEYGHFLDDMAGGILSGGLSEGWGDLLATYASGQPLIGEGLAFARTANNAYQYPANGADEVHALGQAWAGFAWHLRQRLIAALGSAAGIALAEQLVVPVVLANSPDIPSAVEDVILRDDDDGNLANGTPHLLDIWQAASQHSIPIQILNLATITHPVQATSLRQADGSVTVTGTAEGLTTGAFAFKQYELFYGQGQAPSTWTPITAGPVLTPVTNGPLGTWQIGALPDGAYSLKLVVTTMSNFLIEKTVVVGIEANPPRRITSLTSIQRDPAISGPWIVWEDIRNQNEVGLLHSDIYLFDAKTGIEHRITTDGTAQARAAMSESRIVWTDFRHGKSEIYVCDYDAATGACPERRITTSGDNTDPSISVDIVVWQNISGAFSGLPAKLYACRYDPATGACPAVQISATEAKPEGNVEVSGNRMVWSDRRSGNTDIFLCEFDPVAGTCPNRQLTTNAMSQWGPAIAGNLIVWEDYRNDGGDIYYCEYNAATGACPEQVMVAQLFAQRDPAISGTRVVWMDWRDRNYDIYSCEYNPTTHTCPEQLITAFAFDQRYPVVSGRRIAWEDGRNGNLDIYMMDLNKPAVLAPIGDRTVPEADPVTFTVTATDPDGDLPLVYSASGLPAGATFDAASGAFQWVPDSLQGGPSPAVPGTSMAYQITFTATDAEGLASAPQTVTITVQDRCHVLTAAFGTPQAWQITALRTFRERYLHPEHPWHQRFLAWYDAHGPRAAAVMTERPWLKALVRAVFTPAAQAARWWMEATR